MSHATAHEQRQRRRVAAREPKSLEQVAAPQGFGSVLQLLQRTAGNKAVASAMASKPTVQRQVAGSTIPTISVEDLPDEGLLLTIGTTDSSRVERVQSQLNERGASPPLRVTGVFDEETRDAVMAYQRRHFSNQRDVDGKVGPRTWQAMFETPETPEPKDQRPDQNTPIAGVPEGKSTKAAETAASKPMLGVPEGKSTNAAEKAASTTSSGPSSGVGGPSGPAKAAEGASTGQGGSGAKVGSSSLVEGEWTDPTFSGLQQTDVQSFTSVQFFALLSKVAPHMSRDLKFCLVGLVIGEQTGRVPNFNFAGLEGDWSKAWAVMLTSAYVDTAKYESLSDKSKYTDWDFRTHNPKFGRAFGHDAGTIPYQLALTPKPKTLVVCVRKRRPAFQTAESGAEVLIQNLEKRFDLLRASKDPRDNDLAMKALAGDAHAFATVVSHRITVTDSSGKKRSIGAWNDDVEYGPHVEKGTAKARAELAKTEPAAASH